MTGSVLIDFPGGRAYRFERPARVLSAAALPDVIPVLDAAHAAACDGAWVAGYVSYEAAPAFDPALRVRPPARMPLAWFGVYATPVTAAPAPAPPATRLDWQPLVTEAEHAAAVAAIRAAIARGDVYQVNHTLRLRASGAADPRALHAHLRRAQPAAYAAYLDLGEFQVLSVSPELFFERRGTLVRTRPMKGTRARGRWAEEDEALADALRHSEKDRAENLMIVDLLRNDLGRVAATGTVRVPRLFAIERHPTVWQMTSTIEADVPPERTTTDLFRALFPCGSVTGAPKIAAMKFIAALEREPRELYCGAIGVIEPGGDCTFNVAIRTAWRDAARATVEYGVGGGITWDSDAAEEWREALSKAAVLDNAWPASFALLETLRAEGPHIVRRERHVRRLLRSAEYFGMAVAADRIEHALDAVAPVAGARRLRLLVEPTGDVRVETSPIDDVTAFPLVLARTPVDSSDPFLYHKTTHRAAYETRAAERPDAFDVLLSNERGELTEFTRGNLVVELDGVLYTPPRSAGLLPGVLREELLERGEIRERTLRPPDLERAGGIWLINSLRGRVAAVRS